MYKCEICKRYFKVITGTHTQRAHNLELKEYSKRFGKTGTGFAVNVSTLPKTDLRYKKWLKSLLGRPSGWSKGYTKESHPSVAKISNTFRKKKIDNFKRWRGEQMKSGLLPLTNKPLKKSIDLAFLIGITLGDGNITRFPRTECLRITLASKYPGLIHYSKKSVSKVFNKNPYAKKVRRSACYTITLYQKNISKRLGIPAGNRRYAIFKTPTWIFKNKMHLLNFIRGLFEAEGSLSIHLPTCTYNFQFSNKNESLLNEVQKSLIKLGFHPERRINSVRLRKKLEVGMFKKLISFRKYDK